MAGRPGTAGGSRGGTAGAGVTGRRRRGGWVAAGIGGGGWRPGWWPAWRAGVFSAAASPGAGGLGACAGDGGGGAGGSLGDDAGGRDAGVCRVLDRDRAGRRDADLAAAAGAGDQPGAGAVPDG